ncbi:MAG TPA: hypothetical protein VMS64_16975 [Candidatus Methylomirabilis sp.]|nr:hypothetical protein [Candidatus Methylomirabilis sp.]
MARFANLALASIALTSLLLGSGFAVGADASDPEGRHREIFYVGDGNNTVRRYDAKTGEYLDSSPSPVVANGVFVFIDPTDGTGAGGLAGPRGMVLDDGRLLVTNQNVGLPLTSAILEYRRATGSFKDALVPALSVSDPETPFASRGTMVLWRDRKLFVPDQFNGDLDCDTNTIPSGRLLVYTKTGEFIAELTADPSQVPPEHFHPESVVLGPDGLLYVSSSLNLCPPNLGGQVLRFDPKTFKFKDVFISDDGGNGHLNRPEGLVFDPPGRRLYVLGFRNNFGDLTDPENTDAIRIYSARTGEFKDKIDLWQVGVEDRAFAAGLVFGPKGKLFVPINGPGSSTLLGQVRRYDVDSKTYEVFVPPPLGSFGGTFPIFENTDPATLDYDPDDHDDLDH